MKPSYLRFDILILVSYQMCHFYGIQQIFPIFLNYAPKTTCEGDRCFNVPAKCMDCPDCTDLCADFTTPEAKASCVSNYTVAYYYSANMEYLISCKPFYKRFTPASCQYSGVLLGNIVLGFVADYIGRRKTFILSLAVGIPALAGSAAIGSLLGFYILRFVTGFAIAGTMVVGWAFFSELVSAHNRFKLRTFSNWANARLMLTIVCHITGNWKMSSYVSAAISCITLAIVVFVLPESHIWLRKMGRYEESEESRKRVAWLAGVEFEPLPPPVKTEFSVPEKSVNVIDVLMDSGLRKNLLVLWFMWFSTGLTAYLTDLTGGDMTSNFWVGQYLSCILLSLVRIAMGFADGYLPWMGRRVVLLGCQTLAVIFFVGLIIILSLGYKGEWFYTVCYLSAFVFTSIVWEPCYLCASELMPTDVRATSTASCSIVGRVANILASLLTFLKHEYEPGLHMISGTVGSLNILVGYLWLTETKNVSLDKTGVAKKTDGDSAVKSSEMVDLLPKNGDDHKEADEKTRKHVEP